MYWVGISTQSKIWNSYNKTNKCTNVKIIFLYAIYENSDVFRSTLIIFRELLTEYDQDRSKHVSELLSTLCVCVCVCARARARVQEYNFNYYIYWFYCVNLLLMHWHE